jgi:spermidine synthase
VGGKLTEEWFSESLDGNFAHNYRVKKLLFKKRTPFQKIEVLDTYAFGKMLVLDGAVQTAVEDEYIYHEMIVHLPLITHPRPQTILIIGGGDGGALRRVLEHPVKKVTLVELDKEVIKVAKKFFSEIHKGTFEDKRAIVKIENGVEFLKEREGEFDIIIIDSTDPVGEAKALFSPDFYSQAYRALKEEGILATQSGSPFFQRDVVKEAYSGLKKFFPIVKVALFPTPTYPGVLWSITLGSKKHHPSHIPNAEIERRMKERGLLGKNKYYNPEIHLSSLSLPQFLTEALENES